MILTACLWFSVNCYYYKPIPKYETKEEIKQYIVTEFKEAGINPAHALAVANCESHFNTKATHTNTNGSTDGGIWQINSIHKMDDKCRFDLRCSTQWVINKVKHEGNWSAWTCSKAIQAS